MDFTGELGAGIGSTAFTENAGGFGIDMGAGIGSMIGVIGGTGGVSLITGAG